MFHIIKKVIAIMNKQTLTRLALLIIPMLLMTCLEVISIGLILPVIQIVLLGETEGGAARYILEYIPEMEHKILGFWVAGIFTVFFIFKNAVLFWTVYIVNLTINYATADYTKYLFQIYISKPLVFHFKNNSANLLRNITAGVGLTLDTGRISLLMLLDVMMMLGAAVLLAFIEPYTTLGASIFLCAIGYIFTKIASPKFRHWGHQSMILEGQLIKWINQSLIGIRDVKLFQAHDFLTAKVWSLANARAKYSSYAVTSIQIPRLLVETAIVVGFLGVIILFLLMDRSSGSVVTTLGLFGMAALRIMPSLNRFLSSASEIRHRESYINTIYDVFCSNKDGDTQLPYSQTVQLLPFEKEIKIDDITYTYPDSERHALRKFNLTIQKGTSVGFVGSSGSGKSTLMDIILGLLIPTSGQLLIDGKNAYENISGWQRRIGFVQQQIFVMDDTIRRNIAFAIEDDEIDDMRIKSVLEVTQLDTFVNDLPKGIDTILGEHGTRLSGGQRQRIAIARALYHDPDVLVFDEATSSLDNITEREITRAIDILAGDKTILIVAHRLSTVYKCDQIVFMKDGRLNATGTYAELMESNVEFQLLAQIDTYSKTKDEELAL